MGVSKIEWTDATWNPVAGCTWASPGCDHCYAATMARRLEAMGQADYAGLTTKKHFNGVIRTLPDKLDKPLRWKKPRMVFVNSMSDLFHKDVPFDFIDKVFGVMAKAYWHTFQVLTKRPERMAEYFAHDRGPNNVITRITHAAQQFPWPEWKYADINSGEGWSSWPYRNVWLGTSVEDQQRADERIPHLHKCPSAVRFLSCEPLLGPIDLSRWIAKQFHDEPATLHTFTPDAKAAYGDGGPCLMTVTGPTHWVIVGGESVPHSRPFNIEWARSIIAQCKAADVACFVKQLGRNIEIVNDRFDEWPREGDGLLYDAEQYGWRMQGDTVIAHTVDKKGGNPAEWPADLCVREFPKTTEAVC